MPVIAIDPACNMDINSDDGSPSPEPGSGSGSSGSPVDGITKVVEKHVQRIFKIIVIGDSNVGKTCLTFRFCGGKFPDKTEATIGVDFREKTVVAENETIKVLDNVVSCTFAHFSIYSMNSVAVVLGYG